MYLHVDVTDRYGFCIITVTIQGHLAYTHSEKLIVGKFLRLENFSVKEKDAYEKGDSDFVLKISSSTMCSSISPSSRRSVPQGFKTEAHRIRFEAVHITCNN